MSQKSSTNLLRLSGILFGVAGTFHIIRYYTHWEFRVGTFELTETGSLIIGSFLLVLSFACFKNPR